MRVKTQYKFFTWIVLIAIGSMPLDSLARSTITVQRSYDPSEIEVTTTTEDDGNNYSKIKWNDLYSNAKPGSPELPVDYVRFIVPMYSNNFSVTVTPDGSNADIPIEGRIYPAQTPRTTSDDSPPVFLAPSSDDYVPELNRIRAEVVGDGFIDGCNHIVTVAIYPFNYNDDALELTSDYGMTIELSYDECDASDLTSTPIVPPHRSKYLNLEETVVNPDNLAEFSTTDINLDAIDYYYIITPRNLADACEDLAIWKRQKGYNVVVKVVEDIFEIPEYRVDVTTEIKDEAASLREYLKDEFEAHGAFFCLLVGDYRTSMPIRKSTCTCSWHVKKSTNPNSEYYVPTDMYFSDLSKKNRLGERNRRTYIFVSS